MVLLATAVGLIVALSLQPGPPAAEQPTSKPYVEQLGERLDCWGNDGGQHPFPTRVIYRRGGDWQIGGRRVVDQALDQIFNGTDHGLEVYKFCVARATAVGGRWDSADMTEHSTMNPEPEDVA